MKLISHIIGKLKKRRFFPLKKPGGSTLPREGETSLLSRRDVQRLGLASLTILVLSLLMLVNLMPDRVALRLGDTSPKEIRAARGIVYFNREATAFSQQTARSQVTPIYDRDFGANQRAELVVNNFFDKSAFQRKSLASLRKPSKQRIEQTVSALRKDYSSISPDLLRYAITQSETEHTKLRSLALTTIRNTMRRDIRDFDDINRPSNDLRHAQSDINPSIKDLLNANGQELITAMGKLALSSNMILNLQKTEAAKEAAVRNVSPIYDTVARGDKIIGSGEIVNEVHLEKLAALGLLNPRLDLATSAGVCILATLMVFLIVYFISHTLPHIYADIRKLALLSIITIISVLGLKFGSSLLGLSFSSGQLGFLGMMSVVAAGMLVSVLLDVQLAVLIVALLSALSGLLMNHEIRFTVMTLMSSLIGIFAVGQGRRSHLPMITLALSLANLSLVWLLGIMLRDSITELLTGSAWAVVAGAFATFLYWVGILMLEKPFGILTHHTLLELSSTDSPPLKHLCIVAPGTYAHSIMVGILAEAGAQAIGANALLCRVGGYYHDIGKIRRPDFFVENQRVQNVHGRISPSLSALIITAHVRDGLEIARENRLPLEIRDIIAQHHGTTLIRYFYHQALVDCGGEKEAPPGLEERFRYQGPKPQSLEAAIVMLADSVEAATRSLNKPDDQTVREMIAKLAKEKLEDNQFNECPITLAQMQKVIEAFEHVILAMMHGRIEYPKEFPKTASGQPMEVSRADLRSSSQPNTLVEAEPLDLEGAVAEFDESFEVTQSEDEIAREKVAHLSQHTNGNGNNGHSGNGNGHSAEKEVGKERPLSKKRSYSFMPSWKRAKRR